MLFGQTTASEFAGIKVVGIAANVADDDEPAVRITVSDGTSIVSQVDPLATDHYTVVLTRPECWPCHLKRGPIDVRCMTRLGPERVLQAAERLLGRVSGAA